MSGGRWLGACLAAAVAFALPLQGAVAAAAAPAPALPANPLRSAWFGDLHLHTSNSYDAAWGGVRTTPRDAYRYAQGLPVDYMGKSVRRKAALDFLAVADHSEYMGVPRSILEQRPPFEDSNWLEQLQRPDKAGFTKFLRSAFYGPEVLAEFNTPAIKRDNWQAVIAAADEAYQPGRFTTFAAFEWSNTPGGNHFHRVAVFPGPRYPDVPFTALDSRHPEDLWRYADAARARGIDSVLIPHNSNLSGGLQFSMADSYGKPLDRDTAALRARNERLVEVTQIKGTSETHPELSPDDEFAGFEILEHYAGGGRGPVAGSYVRDAYRRGLELASRVGVNPFAFGMVGSSDYHSGTTATEEDNHTGALGDSDWPHGEGARKVLNEINPVIRAPVAALSASGITGVWAEQNTRESIFAAFKRREVFATSGPRLQVRLFASFDYPAGLMAAEDWLARAYARGVPMGGDLKPARRGSAARPPRLLLQAVKDPDGANLDRLQVVKVWMSQGRTHERVYDVVGSGGRRPDPATGRMAAVGSTVDATRAVYANTIGAARLQAEWVDPDFDPKASALYYARVIEIPTPRWSTYLAVRNGLPLSDKVPASLQERAWTSPVFYSP
ncbi:MAG: hypothetical protein RL026_1851 [Pseudomonadota bacterium]|jgi:hypothetical protein